MKYFLCIWVLCMVYLAESASNCCYSSSSTITPLSYPYFWSPAGGQRGNPDATVCFFHRRSKCVVCKKEVFWGQDIIKKCCVAQPQGEHTEIGGPTPEGEYLIGGFQRNPRKNNIPWRNLYKKKRDNSGYFGYTSRTEDGRSTFALHPGTRSEGCVVVTGGSGRSSCWHDLNNIVEAGSMTYRGSDYNGILFVVP